MVERKGVDYGSIDLYAEVGGYMVFNVNHWSISRKRKQ